MEMVQMKATSTDARADGTASVVLYWGSAGKGSVYNLARRGAAAAQMPPTPLNGGTPIEQVKDKASFEAQVPPASDDWKRLQGAFTALQDPPSSVLVDPGDAIASGLTEKEDKAFEALAQAYLKIRQARGLAYVDPSLTVDGWYVYELRRKAADGQDEVLVEDVTVQAGRYQLPDPPAIVDAYPGDHKVLVLWHRNDFAFTYNVTRAVGQAGAPQVVNDGPLLFDVVSDLDGKPLTGNPLNGSPLGLARPGFLDFQRWSCDGLPISHTVAGNAVEGPSNYVN
jgi:hypothetical protein